MSIVSTAFGALLVTPLAAAEETDPCETPLDVLFLFDTTGSMGGVINSAQSGATDIMHRIVDAAPGARFSVANYRDYPGFYSYPGYSNWYGAPTDWPWELNEPFTTNTAAAKAAIDSLRARDGGDYPESLSRALYEANHLDWNSAATRIVVLLADAPPHTLDFNGRNTGSDPGRDGIAGTADDLVYQDVVADLRASGIQVVAIDSGNGDAESHFRYLGEETKGIYARLASDFVGQVTDLVLRLAGASYAAEGYALRASVATGAAPASVTFHEVSRAFAPAGGNEGVVDATFVIGSYAFTMQVASGTAEGDRDGLSSTASATGRIVGLSLTDQATMTEILRADVLRAESVSRAYVDEASSTGDSSFAGLSILGSPVAAAPPANTVTPLGTFGFVVLNEQVADTLGGETSLLVNAIRVVLDLGAAGDSIVEVVVASAASAASCGGPAVTRPAPNGDVPMNADLPLDASSVRPGFWSLHDPLGVLPDAVDEMQAGDPGAAEVRRSRSESQWSAYTERHDVTEVTLADGTTVSLVWYGEVDESGTPSPASSSQSGRGEGTLMTCHSVLGCVPVSVDARDSASTYDDGFYSSDEERHRLSVSAGDVEFHFDESSSYAGSGDTTYWDYGSVDAWMYSDSVEAGVWLYRDSVNDENAAYVYAYTPMTGWVEEEVWLP